MSEHDKPSIVFCHGIWADGSCFSSPPLRAEGYEVISAQYNLDSAQSDIDSVIRTLGRVSSPSILVGHSYGGAVITGAGIDDRVVGLVYIAAVAPDDDETAASQQAKYPVPTCSSRSRSLTAASGCSRPASATSAEICRKRSSRSCGRRRRRPPRPCSTEKPAGTAWRTKPSAYVVATHDHSVHPDLQRASAKRMGAATYAVASAHCAMLSHPDVVSRRDPQPRHLPPGNPGDGVIRVRSSATAQIQPVLASRVPQGSSVRRGARSPRLTNPPKGST